LKIRKKINLKMIVTGMSRHGKDTMCEYLRDNHGINFAASSYTACEIFLYEKLKDEFGYKSLEECFEDRLNHKERWYTEIKDFNTPDLAKLGRYIFKKAPTYCGIRDDEELEELIISEGIDLIVWVDASKRKPPQSSCSMKLNASCAHVTLDNNGTKEEFHQTIETFYQRKLKPIILKNLNKQ
jgi:dephospho-CoA kinase